MKNIFVFLAVFIVTPFSSLISQTDSDSTKKKDSSGWIALPFASYSPETEWAFGVAGLYYFHTVENPLPDSRSSNIIVAVQYTTKKQFLAELDYDFYFSNEEYRFFGYSAYGNFPFSYFGIGNNTQQDDEENYTPRFINSKNTFLIKLQKNDKGGIYAGVKNDFRYDKIIEIESGRQLDTSNVTGSDGGTVSGLGLNINLDTRDNTFTSTSGEFIDVQAIFYGNYFLSDFDFNSFTFDARKYLSLNVFNSSHVLASQFYTRLTTGEVPFYYLSTFGGKNDMRGIFTGRFRDKDSYFLQAEYRFPVYWIVGMVVFGGMAQSTPEINKFSFDETKFSYGLGFRLNVIPSEGISLRADFGFADGEGQLYLGFGEAF
jgi:hypothetical protein